MSLVLNVEILGEFKKLTEATKGSQKSLSNLEDGAKKISSGINKTLGLIGVGFSLNFLVDQFKESTKAAIEDQKSKVLLTQALQNNIGVTKQQNDQIEQYITKTQLATSITDDKLRPAFAKLAIATKDTDQAMKLMTVAVDVAAGTGKNLDAVVQAMSRALAGNETALFRLVPSIKGADDPMKALATTFAGAAEAAANTDPYAKMQIIFGEMQEQIGEALLPVLTEFSTWLSTPEGQEKLEAIVAGIVDVVEWFGEMSTFIADQVMPMIEKLTGEKGFGAIITTITTAIGVLSGLKLAMMFLSAGNPVLAGVIAGIALLAAAYVPLKNNLLAAVDAQNKFKSAFGGGTGVPLGSGSPFVAAGGKIGVVGKTEVPQAPAPKVDVPLKPGNVKVDVQATINADSLVKQINDKLKNQGSSLRIQ
jgi:hypothetical protein